MSRPDQADIGALLDWLGERGIDFVVVGGAAALLHGAPIATRDLDIVPDARPENLDALAAALAELDAIFREPGSRILPLRREHLDGSGQLLLRTRLGPLDVLLRLHGGEDYALLAPESEIFEVDGRTFRVIALERLIAVKAAAGRARDLVAVPLLLQALRQRDPT
ncbi:MAG: hypothetical protein FJ102_03310 [Deltaproteobacteria bacterium]|nr:hypothetical protein [Deltaproteobacteria bacterium]